MRISVVISHWNIEMVTHQQFSFSSASVFHWIYAYWGEVQYSGRNDLFKNKFCPSRIFFIFIVTSDNARKSWKIWFYMVHFDQHCPLNHEKAAWNQHNFLEVVSNLKWLPISTKFPISVQSIRDRWSTFNFYTSFCFKLSSI